VSNPQRDAGLVRVVGPRGLAANIVNTVVGAGIFAVPAALAMNAGAWAPLAFLICAVAMGAIAICFAEGGSRVPTSGGAYGSIEAAFGPLAAYVGGTRLWLGNLLACASIAAALGGVAGSLVPATAAVLVSASVIVGVLVLMALVNVASVAGATRVVAVATAVKLVPLIVFVVAGAFAVHGANLVPAGRPDVEGLGRALILALFALTGIEGSLSVSGEVTEPARTIPRALALAMISVSVLYLAIQIVAQGVAGPSLGQSVTPLADVMAHVHPALRLLMLGGAALSMFGWLASDILSTPRVLFAFSRDGLLPRALGRLHADNHTPQVAITIYTALAMALALTGTFAELAVLATLASAALYIGVCLAAWRLARRDVALAGPPLDFRGLSVAVVVGVGSMLALITLASKAEILGLIAVTAGSALICIIQSSPPRRATLTR
jgi:amino acid transporter